MKQIQNPPQLNLRLSIQIGIITLLLVIISISAYRAFNRSPDQQIDATSSTESFHEIQLIPLSGEITDRKSEISGMAWYGDYLILLPQYPHRLANHERGYLFALSKANIESFLDGETNGPLEPITIPINSQIYVDRINGFEGFEAIAFYDDQVYLTIEASNPMRGYLVTGVIDGDLEFVRLDPGTVEISQQVKIDNFSDEAIIIYEDKIFTFYEANGESINPQPVTHVFDLEMFLLGSLPMPNIEYRLTDASVPDIEGNFWVINYFFVGDLQKTRPGPDQFSSGIKSPNLLSPPIERLVQLKVTDHGIIIGDHKPIRLSISENAGARNWEALAVLDGRGFLIATDKYPDTILAFVRR